MTIEKTYCFEDNMHIIDEVINELILTRTLQEFERWQINEVRIKIFTK